MTVSADLLLHAIDYLSIHSYGVCVSGVFTNYSLFLKLRNEVQKFVLNFRSAICFSYKYT